MERKPVPPPVVQSVEEPKVVEDSSGYTQPPWETTDRQPKDAGFLQGQSRRRPKQQFLATFNRIVPPHRRYCGLSRRFAVVLGVTLLLAVLALVLGLAIGLSLRNQAQHLALPLGSQTYKGDLTYYGTGLGACGVVANDAQDIVSISHFTFDAVQKGSNPNANPLCGHKLRVVRDGNSVDLTVVDRCVGCKPTDIDVSPAAFKKLANPDLGRVVVEWAWLPPIPAT